MDIDYSSLATIIGEGSFQEVAIILPGPPIEIFAQRGAPSVVLKSLRQTDKQGKYYYECQTATGGYMQIGWADEEFQASAEKGKGCGDDKHSWAYDGMRCLKWNSNQKEPFGRKWKEGDVIGVAVDLSQGEVMFSLNGDWSSPLGTAFTGIKPEGGIYPCMSLVRGQRLKLFLGTDSNPFTQTPPNGYHPLTITHPASQKTDTYNKYSSYANIIKMSLSELSFSVSRPGEMMVKMMGRGLQYEAKKNAMMHGGYEATIKRWEETKEQILTNVNHVGLSEDEIHSIICYTLEMPPVYRFFNNDARKGYKGDGMDFPIITYLLSEACRKVLASTPRNQRTRIVYRGVNLAFAADIGQIIRFCSYTSTTGNISVAEEFKKNSSGTQFVIVTKLGVSIKDLSAYPEEDEVLVPPYEAFRVHRLEEGCIYVTSVFDDEFVDKYCADPNAVYQAEGIVKRLVTE